MLLVVFSVRNGIISKRHISDREVEKVVREIRVFVAVDLDFRIRVELLRDSPGDVVKLHAVQGTFAHFFGHRTEKVPDSH